MGVFPNETTSVDSRMAEDRIEQVTSDTKLDPFGSVVDEDDAFLRAQGHVAELNRSFSWVGAVGLAFRYADRAHILTLMCCKS